jgi:hypothetical protein
LSNEPEAEHVSAEFDLMLDVLQHLPLTGAEHHSIQDKWVLHVFRRENKPTPLELANE